MSGQEGFGIRSCGDCIEREEEMKKKEDGTYFDPKDDSITVFGDPDEELDDTAYGKVTYREWCDKEAERMTAAGKGVVEVVTNEETGEIALAEVSDEGSKDSMP